VAKLSSNFTFTTLDGAGFEVFMSFGLLNELCKLVGDPETVTRLPFEHTMRDTFLTALLQDRNRVGKIIGARSMDEMDIDPQAVVAILAWASEHVLDFFINQAVSIKAISDKNEEKLKAL
jgi:hypothetical protein